MGLQTTIINRDPSARIKRELAARLVRAVAFAERTAGGLAKDWAGLTRSGRVAAAIRVVKLTATSFRVEARTVDVGFNPHFNEFDTAPHVISPTKSHGLLVWPMNGGLFFRRGPVNHPGTKGDHALELTVEQTLPKYLDGLRKIFAEGQAA